MKKVIFGSLLLVLALQVFNFLERVSKGSEKRTSEAPSSRELAATTKTADSKKQNPKSPTSVDVADTIRDCLPINAKGISGHSPLSNLTEKLKNSPTAKSHVEVENLHVVASDGTEFRLMISPSDLAEFHGLEAKLFTVDKDGLPVPAKLPQGLSSRDVETVKKHFLDLGTLRFDETVLVFKDEVNKVSGRLTYQMGVLSQAEVYEESHFLGCAIADSTGQPDCKCL